MNKLVLLGDSFCNNECHHNPINESIGWFTELKRYFNQSEYYNLSEGGKDYQTIIDEWIKLLPILNNEDVLIIWFPVLSRLRIPLSKKNYKKYKIDTNHKIIDRFVGIHNDYNTTTTDTEIWNKGYTENYFIKSLKDQMMIQESIANRQNFLEIVESLYKMTNSNVYLFTWDVFEYDSSVLMDKNTIEKSIGFWETKIDLFHKTKGEFGLMHDDHFSYETHFAFFEYLKNKIDNHG